MTLATSVDVYLNAIPGATVNDYYDFVKWTRYNHIERITPQKFTEWFKNAKKRE